MHWRPSHVRLGKVERVIVRKLSRPVGSLCCWFLLVLVVGCAGTSRLWRDPLGRGTNDPLPPNSLTARVHQIENVAAAAASLDGTEREQVVQRLNATLASSAEPVALKLVSVKALGALRSRSAMVGLETATRSPEPELRVMAAKSLANNPDPAAVTLLTELLTYDSNADVRLAAATALARFSSPSAIEALAGVLGDRDPAVQLVAMRSVQTATGQELGSDVGKWKAYVATLPPSRGGRETEDEAQRY